MQVGFLKVQETIEDYFDEGLEIGLDKVSDWDSKDICTSWTILRILVESEVRTQRDQDLDFCQMNGSEQVEQVGQELLVEQAKQAGQFQKDLTKMGLELVG